MLYSTASIFRLVQQPSRWSALKLDIYLVLLPTINGYFKPKLPRIVYCCCEGWSHNFSVFSPQMLNHKMLKSVTFNLETLSVYKVEFQNVENIYCLNYMFSVPSVIDCFFSQLVVIKYIWKLFQNYQTYRYQMATNQTPRTTDIDHYVRWI